jgi:methylenetetrahydrofolate reductase (NADPH)
MSTTRLESCIREKQFVLTAEIVPPLSADKEKLLTEAALLGEKVTAINVTDAAAGRTTMSSFAAAAILAANGYEPILQVTCRDRNRIALAGDLIGASAQGVHNLLMLRGDDPKDGDQPDAKPVFDLSTQELMSMARDMRDKGMLPSEREIDPPPKFVIGGADVPALPGRDWKPDGLRAKLEAGANFIQTQFCFDLDHARHYAQQLEQAGLTEHLGFIVGVGPIPSARSARWMNENLFGVFVPDHVIERLEQAEDARAEGRRICAELIAGMREIPGIAGAHIMAPARGAQAIAEVLEMVS